MRRRYDRLLHAGDSAREYAPAASIELGEHVVEQQQWPARHKLGFGEEEREECKALLTLRTEAA